MSRTFVPIKDANNRPAKNRPLKTTLSHEDNGHIESVICPCGLGEQTTSHIPHTCPLHTAERECTWTTKSSREDKLQGTATDLRQCGSLLWLDCDIWLTVHIERWIRRVIYYRKYTLIRAKIVTTVLAVLSSNCLLIFKPASNII